MDRVVKMSNCRRTFHLSDQTVIVMSVERLPGSDENLLRDIHVIEIFQKKKEKLFFKKIKKSLSLFEDSLLIN